MVNITKVQLLCICHCSVTECRKVDEQKHVFMGSIPVMTQERFSQLSGLTEGQVRGMIEKGHLPSIKIGKPRLVNVAALSREALEKDEF